MLYVEHARDIDAATWDRWVRESPGGGHVLQTFAWGEFKGSQGWTPMRLALKDGAEVRGVAQVLVRRLPGTSGAMAYCAKGPWIDWSDAEQVSAMLGGMEHFAHRHGAYVLKVESELLAGPGLPTARPRTVEAPLRRVIRTARRLRGGPHTPSSTEDRAEDDKRVEEARAALLEARAAGTRDGHTAGRRVFAERGYVKGQWDLQHRTTMVVDLDRSPEEMLARMKSKWRYNVNLARRKGVTIVENNGHEARRILYDLHAETSLRDGFPLRPKQYFDDAWERMISAGYGQIFLACHEGRPLAGLLAFTFGDKVWYQVGASRTEGRNLMPAHALQFHVMAWARQRGMTYYDLVAIPSLETIGPRDPMWGLYTFKSGFGGRPVEWAGCFDKVLDPRGHAWEALEPAYYRLFRWRTGNWLY